MGPIPPLALASALVVMPLLLAGPASAGPEKSVSEATENEALPLPEVAASEEIMSTQAGGPPSFSDWGQTTLDSLTQNSVNASIGTAAAVGYVKIDRNSVYHYYDDRVAPPQSTYTPPPTYP